jgi:hypothetical protein
MSPSSNVGMELPPPVSEKLPPANFPEKTEQSHEQQLISPLETAPAPSVGQPFAVAPPPLDIPTSALPQSSPATNAGTDDSQSASLMADDGDLIEKEWVHKAKSIVERTREDPYKQTEELMQLKADYLQKRYSKTIKQST